MSDEKTILEEAQEAVYNARHKDYGHPLDNFTRVAQMWSAILGFPVTPEQVGLCMCAMKISRQVNAHRHDNLVDLAGYAATVALIVKEEFNRGRR